MLPTNKRTARARENHTAAILSRKPLTVAQRTLTPGKPSHSLKTAGIAFRCPHTRQGVKRLLAASRGCWWPIKVCYGSDKFWQVLGPYHRTGETRRIVAIRHNPPPIDSPVFRSTIRGMRIADQIRDADGLARNDQSCLSDKGC